MLEAELTATPSADGVDLALTITNGGRESVELSFRSGQRVEFVAREDGDELWRWSDGRMFTQALSSAELAPGEETTFEAGWSDPPAGTFTITGWVVAQDVDVSDEAVVEL